MNVLQGHPPPRSSLVLFGAGGLTLAVTVVLAAVTSQSFLSSYLIAVLYWLGLCLGALGWLLVGALTGGRWCQAITPPSRTSIVMLPLMAALFVPLLLMPGRIYPWVGDTAVEMHGMNVAYLTQPFFILRAIVYFAVWIGFGYVLSRMRSADSQRRGPGASNAPGLAGVGLIAYVVTVSLAAIDWGMSLDPNWVSTIYGLLFVTGQAVASLALAIVVITWPAVARRAEVDLAGAIDPDILHDLGNLLLTAVAVWAYVGFSQLLIYWSGNLSAEVGWYVVRMNGFWGGVLVVLGVMHFGAPLVLLLSRDVKRQPGAMCAIAIALLVLHLLDLLWRIVPSFDRTALWPIALDVLATVGVGGIWLGAWLWRATSDSAADHVVASTGQFKAETEAEGGVV